LQVALKRQQAAEDAIALGLTAVATGTQYGYLPPGPIFGMAITAPKSQDQGKSYYFTTQEGIFGGLLWLHYPGFLASCHNIYKIKIYSSMQLHRFLVK
jgi:hypothetical protein